MAMAKFKFKEMQLRIMLLAKEIATFSKQVALKASTAAKLKFKATQVDGPRTRSD